MRLLKHSSLAVLIVYCLLRFSVDSFSAGDPLECVITIKSIQLKKDSGEWITVSQPDHQVDVISQKPSISFFNKSRRVPAGNYKNFRIILSESVQVKGNEGINMTKAGGSAVIGSTASEASELPGQLISFQELSPTWTIDPAEQGRATFTLNFNPTGHDSQIQITGRDDFLKALSVKEHSFIRVGFLLDLSGTLHYSGSESWGFGGLPAQAIYFLPPKQVEQATVTVDEQEITIHGQDIRMVF